MDRIFVRSFVLFVIALLAAVSMLGYLVINGSDELAKNDSIVLDTQEVIASSEALSTKIEGMLADQRGYIMTGDKMFMDDYQTKKASVSELVAKLSELTRDNQSQQRRLDELRTYLTEFSTKLEERAQNFALKGPKVIIPDVQVINNLKNDLIRINSAILQEERGLLSKRLHDSVLQKESYFESLLIGGITGTALLLLLNGFLLQTQRQRNRAEASLKDTEERLTLAIEGTQDGIFDWNTKTDRIFYSRRFFEMLGHARPAYTGRLQDAHELLHPDDAEEVITRVNQYLSGEISEYDQVFRMQHKNGHWVWIQSRAKVIHDEYGRPCRMVGAHTDITAMKLAQERLAAEKKHAEAASQAKSDFLAHMSHEIRTPLTAITGIVEIFERYSENLNDKQKKLVSTLRSSSSALKDLINDVLDFSKIESGDLELDEENFVLGDLFEDIRAMMTVRAAEKGISFVFDPTAVWDQQFYGDTKRLRQIVVNLIGNAIKFTDKGAVTIRVFFEDTTRGRQLRIDVTDSGIGIAPENFDLIFERFKQADSSVSRRYGGTGLGLPISRNLAQLMGGEIILSSETGKGSRFSVMLPDKIVGSDAGASNLQSGDGDGQDTVSREGEQGGGKILIVEDYDGNVVVLSYFLDDLGLMYDIARDGGEAVAAWRQNHYDAILMDVQMPIMDGFAATREIRRLESLENLPRTPIIGMTAHALVGDKDKCIEAGMDAYLPKPIVSGDLEEELIKYLTQQRRAA